MAYPSSRILSIAAVAINQLLLRKLSLLVAGVLSVRSLLGVFLRLVRGLKLLLLE
jgi:hypothetical protein